MTKGFDDVTVTSVDVWHTTERRGETASLLEAGEAVEASGGKDGGGLDFIGRGAGEGVFPSWGRHDGRSQHKSVSTRSWDSGVEHPP